MNVLSSLLNFIGGKISDFNSRITTLRDDFDSLTALTNLTITRVISTTYMTDAQFNALRARKKNGMLYLNFNADFTSTGLTTSDFTTIGTIGGWQSVYDTYITIPKQTDSTKLLIVEVTLNGEIKVYSTSTISGRYRGYFCVPTRT